MANEEYCRCGTLIPDCGWLIHTVEGPIEVCSPCYAEHQREIDDLKQAIIDGHISMEG